MKKVKAGNGLARKDENRRKGKKARRRNRWRMRMGLQPSSDAKLFPRQSFLPVKAQNQKMKNLRLMMSKCWKNIHRIKSLEKFYIFGRICVLDLVFCPSGPATT